MLEEEIYNVVEGLASTWNCQLHKDNSPFWLVGHSDIPVET